MEQVIEKVEISRSRQRRKTVSARLKNSILYIQAPWNIPEQELRKTIKKLQERLVRKKLKKELNAQCSLKDIAERLNEKYFDNALHINAIAYTVNQDKKYGSCNITTGSILISHRLAKMPEWVRDYVIVHELAHLVEPNHSKNFHSVVARYELAERAKGFLLALGFEEE